MSGFTGAADGQKRQRGSTRTENRHGRTRTDNPRVASSIPSLAVVCVRREVRQATRSPDQRSAPRVMCKRGNGRPFPSVGDRPMTEKPSAA